ncbi:DUF4328 domain-containing protein [Akkermansia sp. N21169]|uniref:DUF4328 domain-containing protein n=2 Tax=unclassified Akkermansia TaxID=2608915 RepID=UPI00244E7FB9|nr:DUF4328 domain-containing protein [Akkermansia sp. N21169]MDH3069638.1 DUF4328 domain-containing protein [Akkermansia sp. N21169]
MLSRLTRKCIFLMSAALAVRLVADIRYTMERDLYLCGIQDTLTSSLMALDVFLFFLATAVFLTWLYKSVEMLSAQGGQFPIRYTPGAAVAGCLIPPLFLYRPCLVLMDIRRATAPDKSIAPVFIWWGLLWGGIATSIIASCLGFSLTPSEAWAFSLISQSAVIISTGTLFVVMNGIVSVKAQ